jgi:26S proteasome regulatory subunit N2
MDMDAAASATGDGTAAATATPAEPDARQARAARLRAILSGKTPIGLFLEFLYHHNAADLAILKAIKGAVDARVSVCHSAIILANAYMHAGMWSMGS